MIVKEFFALLGIQVDDSAFQEADTALDTVQNGILALTAAAVAATSALSAMVVSTAHDAAEISKLAALMGVSTDATQELSFAAQRTGVNLGDMGELMSELSENIGEAAQSATGEAGAAFKSLGIATTDANGKLRATDEVFLEIADRMSALGDGTAKTASLMGLFGEQGIQLLPMLNKGSAEIQRMRDEAHELGLVMRNEDVVAGALVTASMNDLSAILTSLKNSIAAKFLPSFLELLKGFMAWWKLNSAITKQRLDKLFSLLQPVLSALVFTLKTMGLTLGFVIDNWRLFAAILLSVVLMSLSAVAAETIFLGIESVAAAVASAYAWLAAAAPLVAMAAIITLIILLLDDIYGFFSGKDSFIGAVIDRWGQAWTAWLDKFTEISPDDPWWLVAIKEAITAARELVALLEKLSPKKVQEETSSMVKGGFGFISNSLTKTRAIGEGKPIGPIAPTPEQQAAFDSLAMKGLEKLSKAGINLTAVNGFTQGTLNGASVAGAAGITNQNKSSSTTKTINAPIQVVAKDNPEETAKVVYDYINGMLSDAEGTQP